MGLTTATTYWISTPSDSVRTTIYTFPVLMVGIGTVFLSRQILPAAEFTRLKTGVGRRIRFISFRPLLIPATFPTLPRGATLDLFPSTPQETFMGRRYKLEAATARCSNSRLEHRGGRRARCGCSAASGRRAHRIRLP